MPAATDLERLRAEYARREIHPSIQDLYSVFNLAYLFMLQDRQRETLRILQRHKISRLDNLNILEVGCGGGGVLFEFLSWGASLQKLHGVDLLFNRLQKANNSFNFENLSCANGEYLPYSSTSFDLVMQFTAISSILDDTIKCNLASEMVRVLRQDGLILWYDFWINPKNKQTKGINASEIRRLFPNCIFDFQKITLAPPIARSIVPVSWGFAHLLESLKILNTHYLVAITQKPIYNQK